MHFIENCPKWPGWPHGFTKKGCTLCCYIKGRIWFIDKAASHMIGRCESQTGDFGVFMRPLTAGSLLGVPNLSSANTTTAGKKMPCLFFSTSEFKSWLFLAFLCYCKLLFDTCVNGRTRKGLRWLSGKLSPGQACVWNVWQAHLPGMKWTHNIFFYLSLTELFQLLSQSRQDRPQERRGLPEKVEFSDLWYFINLY